MKIITDNNFLGGTLTIVSKSNCKTTIGRLVIYDNILDEFIDFVDSASCNKEDNFDTNTGIKIIKLKLTRQYYKYLHRQNKLIISNFGKSVENAKQQINWINKKLSHIDYELNKF